MHRICSNFTCRQTTIMWFDILLTLFLVFLNGFFVAAEFAIVKVRSSQISLQTGTKSKKAAETIIKNLDGFLAATQLGITLASLGLGWVGEDVVSAIILNAMHAVNIPLSETMAHRVALPIAFVTITVLHIVFGELAPKSMAIRYPTSTTLAVSIPLKVFYFVFRPFIVLLNGFANLMLRLVGIKPVSEHEIHSEEELKLLIAESMEGGEIEASERELIQNVFDFDDRVVRQVMVPRVKISAIRITTPIEEAVELILKERYSRYPVFNKNIDDIQGIVHAKDIVQSYIEKSGKTLNDMVRKTSFVSESKRIDHILREFQKSKTQMAIVVSEYGGVVGVVTLEDILEELVGEIQDEYDHEVQIVTQTSTGYNVIATSSIHDINKFLDLPLPESDEYETLAGLLMFKSSGNLKEGQEISIPGFHFKILKLLRHLPELVEVKLDIDLAKEKD